jgi:hypothetical protein
MTEQIGQFQAVWYAIADILVLLADKVSPDSCGCMSLPQYYNILHPGNYQLLNTIDQDADFNNPSSRACLATQLSRHAEVGQIVWYSARRIHGQWSGLMDRANTRA